MTVKDIEQVSAENKHLLAVQKAVRSGDISTCYKDCKKEVCIELLLIGFGIITPVSLIKQVLDLAHHYHQ